MGVSVVLRIRLSRKGRERFREGTMREKRGKVIMDCAGREASQLYEKNGREI